MKLKIENDGPEQYEAVITRPDGGLLPVVLKAGESAEVYCWDGAPVTVTERKAEKVGKVL